MKPKAFCRLSEKKEREMFDEKSFYSFRKLSGYVASSYLKPIAGRDGVCADSP